MGLRLFTADRVVTPGDSGASALLVDETSVVAVGRAKDLRRPSVREHSYPGQFILPGLRDAHFHPVVYAAALHRLTLKEAVDLSDVRARVVEAARHLPPAQPLIGSRLDDEHLAEGRLPTRHDLDQMAPDRPVLLHRYCGHIAVANTSALEAAGVGPETQDPPGGSFDRDGQGWPNGILRETAVAVVGRAVGSRTTGLAPGQLLGALAGLPKLGLTSLGAMVSYELDPWCGVPSELESLLEIAPDLPLDIGVFVIASEATQLRAAAELLAGAGPRLRFLGLKGFADGSLGGHTAALRKPYSDEPGSRGTLRLDGEHTRELARAALDLGGMVALHAIGDLACERVLDLFALLIEEGVDPARLRVEHASLLTEPDLERFAELGVTASVQPAFLPSETTWLEKRLGPDRIRSTYPFASMLSAGIPMAGGSDCPVEQPSPFWGMAAARDRAGIVPTEALDAGQTLALFTSGAAAALGEPVPLAPGSPATFIVVDRDPLTSSPGEVRATTVEAAWSSGSAIELPATEPMWPG